VNQFHAGTRENRESGQTQGIGDKNMRTEFLDNFVIRELELEELSNVAGGGIIDSAMTGFNVGFAGGTVLGAALTGATYGAAQGGAIGGALGLAFGVGWGAGGHLYKFISSH